MFMVIAAISALRCAARGFISELLSMAALLFGLLAAIIFFRSGALVVRIWLPGAQGLPEIIAFIAIFLFVYIIIKIVEITLKGIIDGIKLGGLDHLLGFFLGCAEGVIIICLLLFLISIQPFFDPVPVLRNSFFAKIILPFITGDNKKEILESVVRLGPLGGGNV